MIVRWAVIFKLEAQIKVIIISVGFSIKLNSLNIYIMNRNLFGITCLIVIIFLALAIAMSASNIAIVTWSNSISNPENAEFVEETAFDLEIQPKYITQDMLDKRYDVVIKTVLFIAMIDNNQKIISLDVKTFDEDQLINDLKYMGYDVVEILEIYPCE